MTSLKRIFVLLDKDKDGILKDADLQELEAKCFNTTLSFGMSGVKRVVQNKSPSGVTEEGLTLEGFLTMNTLFITKDRADVAWQILRSFGYATNLRLGDGQLFFPTIVTPDKSVELTSKAVEFLRGLFSVLNMNNDGSLNEYELDGVFYIITESPWTRASYSTASRREARGLTINGFLSKWALMTLLDPVSSVKNLYNIGYDDEPSSAIRYTQRRSFPEKQPSDRTVFQCFVFGPQSAGKSSMLRLLVGRPFCDVYEPTTSEEYAANIVGQANGVDKYLILHEIPEEAIDEFLIPEESLASCDVALIMYDSSTESSWTRAREILYQVACRGKSSGYEFPCLVVAAKDDLRTHIANQEEPKKVCREMRIEVPIPISTKSGNLSDLFWKIVGAAENPNKNIPNTETWKNKLLNTVVGVSAGVGGLIALGLITSRKNVGKETHIFRR